MIFKRNSYFLLSLLKLSLGSMKNPCQVVPEKILAINLVLLDYFGRKTFRFPWLYFSASLCSGPMCDINYNDELNLALITVLEKP